MESKVKLKKAPGYRFAAFILMLLPYMVYYAGIQIIASLGSDIMAAYGIAEGKLSLLSSLGAFAMAILSLVSGSLSAKYGGKKVVIFGLVIIAVSGALYLTNPSSFTLLCFIRLLQGAGTGIVSACVMTLVGVWFPNKERGTAQGALGCFYGPSISLCTMYAYFMQQNGRPWNVATGLLLLVGGGALAVVILLLYKDITKAYGVSIIDEAIEGYVAPSAAAADDGAVTSAGKPASWGEALRTPSFWLLGVVCFFFAATCFSILFALPLFFGSYYNSSEAASIMSLGTLSTIIFSLLGGIVSDRVFKSRRSEVTMIGFAGTAIFLIIMLNSGTAPAAVMTILFFIAYGMLYFTSGPVWSMPVEVVAPEFASQSMGLCLLFSGLGGFVSTNVCGFMIEKSGPVMGVTWVIICAVIVTVSAIFLNRKYHA